MFNDEFFPTPDAVIEKMLAPLYRTYEAYPEYSSYGPRRDAKHGQRREFPTTTILDPSAGSGAILDYVGKVLNEQSWGGYKEDKKLYCFEIDPTLQATLQGKNYRLLGHDFLKYSGDMPIPLILMNPPFSNGDQHVLHAYQVLAPQGQLVALVNSETLRNPYSRTRQVLAALIERVGGTVEELGACFRDSERPTDVEVSIIRLQKPQGEDPFTFNWENKSRERTPDTSRVHQATVMTRDVIGTMLTQYDCLREQFMALLRAVDGIKHYSAGLSPRGAVNDGWRIARDLITAAGYDQKPDYKGQYVSFTERMRQNIWGVVMEKVDIKRYMTEAVRQNFAKYSQQQGYMDFTRENVAQLVNMVLSNKGTILEVAIGQLFDKFTEFHKENRCAVEGWKTNSRYKVNRKLILPNWVQFGEYSGGFEIDYCNLNNYNDIDKVMCYLTGERYETTTLINDVLAAKFKELGRVGTGSFDGLCQSRFFRIRFYKKGTIHLEFLDERLHEEFNLRACAGKLWLPDEEMQAYQRRTASPFVGATPAPGTDQAAAQGLVVDEAVMQLLLGDGADEAPRVVVSEPDAQEAVLPAEATELIEEAQLVPEPPAAAPVVRKPTRPGQVAANQISLFEPAALARAA